MSICIKAVTIWAAFNPLVPADPSLYVTRAPMYHTMEMGPNFCRSWQKNAMFKYPQNPEWRTKPYSKDWWVSEQETGKWFMGCYPCDADDEELNAFYNQLPRMKSPDSLHTF
jgi:hypothetical protein